MERFGIKGAGSERYVTALVLACIILAVGLIDKLWVIWLVLGATYFFALKEAKRLFGVMGGSVYLFAGCMWAIAYVHPEPENLVFAALIVAASIIAFRNRVGEALDGDSRSNFPRGTLLLLYPGASLLFFLSLYKDYGIASLFWLIIIVALADTAAYFTGRAIGRVPFSAASPKKTLEGVAGGVLAATIIGAAMGATFLPIYKALPIAFLVSVASVFGDLFESSLKRYAGVKDSGNMLPGHGGVLDRLDGYLFAAPMMFILLRGMY